MALLRAEIQNRLGSKSIYDCIVEYPSDFTTDPMLAAMHRGSIARCLNLSDDANTGGGDGAPAPETYVKSSDGTWKKVS